MQFDQSKGIFRILWENYKSTPDKTAINVLDNSITYAELFEKGERVASRLYELGVRSQDRVGLMTQNSINWYVLLCATVRLGAIPTPFDPQMGEHEIRYLFDIIGVRTVLVEPQFRTLKHVEILKSLSANLYDLNTVIVDSDIEEEGQIKPFTWLLQGDASLQMQHIYPAKQLTDSNVFFHTTGSTGNPKVVDFPCSIVENNIVKNAVRWGFHENDKFLLTMPMYHCAGFGWGLSCLSRGGELFYDKTFSPTQFLETIEKEKITKVLTTPTLAKIVLTHPRFNEYDISSLECLIFTGEYLSKELVARFTDNFNMKVINALGMTEAFVFLDWHSDNDSMHEPVAFGTIGDIGIKIINEAGELCQPGQTGTIRIGNSVMKGYFRLPDITRKTIDGDGWLNSGDLAEYTDDNRIKFMGRLKRVIKRGGNLVAPEEIEQFLRTHESCMGVIVDSEPDAIMGEKIIAYYQAAPGNKISQNDILMFCKGKISSYKIPDEVCFVDEIPKTVGKANPKLLKELKPHNAGV